MRLFKVSLVAGLLGLALAAGGPAAAHKALGPNQGFVPPERAVASALPEVEGGCRPVEEMRTRVGDARGTAAAKRFEREGLACAKAGDLTAAIAHFTAALEHSAWRPRTLARRGEAQARLGQHEFAVLDFDRAIRLEPGQPRFHHLRAISLAAIGRAEASVDDLEQALRLSDPAVVSRLQQHLRRKGFGTAIDGAYDARTRRALVACISQNCIRL